jgi:hypothetical protein
MKINQHYKVRYDKFIAGLQKNNLTNGRNKLSMNGIVNGIVNHHILPLSLGGEDKPSNLVLVNAREHYICHHMLFKAYPGENVAQWALKGRYLFRFNVGP